jgi:hypothetical protein
MNTILRALSLIICLLFTISFHQPLHTVTATQDIAAALATCSAVLVPNELLTTHSNSTDEAFFDAMCGSWYNNHQTVVDTTLGASAVIELVPVGVDVENNTSVTRVSRTQYCSQTNRRVSQKTKDMFWSRIVPDTARTQWLSCVSAITQYTGGTPHPVTVRLSPVGTENVTLSILYNVSTGLPKPRLAGVEATNLRCGKVNGTPLIPSQGTGITVNCQWTSTDANVGAVIVHTDNRGSEIGTINRNLPPFLTVQLELHKPVPKLVKSEEICGNWFGTVNMDGWKKESSKDGRCSQASDDGKWCKGSYGQTIHARLGGRLRNPEFRCRGNLDACKWNAIGTHQWFTLATNGSGISGETWAGSLSVELVLCAIEDIYGTVDQVKTEDPFQVAKGGGFVIVVPDDSRGIINLRLSDGSPFSLDAGAESKHVSIVGKSQAGHITKWSYVVKP